MHYNNLIGQTEVLGNWVDTGCWVVSIHKIAAYLAEYQRRVRSDKSIPSPPQPSSLTGQQLFLSTFNISKFYAIMSVSNSNDAL